MSHEASTAEWKTFQAEHGTGTVVEATVVSLAPFGAFVEVAPGIHGLLHKDSWDETPEVGQSFPVRISEWGPPRLSVAPAR